ncbi:MAG: YncE family protein [Patescibacteria group bacterium]
MYLASLGCVPGSTLTLTPAVSPPSVPQISFWGEERVSVLETSGADNARDYHDQVSISPLGNSQYFTANYQHIMLVDLVRNTAQTLKHDWSGHYNPTGVAWSPQNQRLYVANYGGNNVLIFQFLAASDEFKIVGEIKTDKSPEGIFVSEDGTRLGVAYYNAEEIQVLALPGDQVLWTQHLGLCHGVCIVGDRVYGTDLGNRELLEFDLETGQILRRVGTVGLASDKLELIWPTYIYPFGADKLILADGLRGTIFIIDRVTLTPISIFGANGPTHKYLALPYCAIWDPETEEMIIGSEAQDRILVLKQKADNWLVSKSLNRHPQQYDALRKEVDEMTTEELPVVNSTNWQWPFCKTCGKARLFGQEFYPGFRSLTPVTDDWSGQIFLAGPQAGLYASDFLITTLAESPSGGYLFVGSRQDLATYFREVEGVPYYLPVPVERGSWIWSNEIHGPTTSGLTTAMFAMLERQSGLNLEESFLTLITENFGSTAGKTFWQKYQSLGPTSSRSQVESIASDYYQAMLGTINLRLTEHALVAMLTGTSAPNLE